MPTLQALIAHYISTTYPSALPAFLAATHEPAPDPARPPVPDLRTLAEDYLSAQLAERFRAVKLERARGRGRGAGTGGWEGWTAEEVVALKLAQSGAAGKEGEGEAEVEWKVQDRRIEGLAIKGLLGVQVARVPRRRFDTASASYVADHPLSLLVSSVDKTLCIVDYDTGEVDRIIEPHTSSILSFALHPTQPRYLLTGAMDGTAVLTDLVTSEPLQMFRSKKYVVRVAFSACGRYMATASYDKTIVLYRAAEGSLRPSARTSRGSDSSTQADVDMADSLAPDSDTDADAELLDETDHADLACDPQLRYEELHRIVLPHNPEAILFVPPRAAPLLPSSSLSDTPLSSGNDDPHGYLVYTTRSSHLLTSLGVSTLKSTTKSFNAHADDDHVSFSVLELALHPSGRVVACVTDGEGAGERVLLYSTDPDEKERLGCVWTGAETNDYVLPRLAWLEDGTGMVTTSPSGHLHLLSLDGTVRKVKLHGGADASGVVRDVAAVPTSSDTARREVVSVGYDGVVRFTEVV